MKNSLALLLAATITLGSAQAFAQQEGAGAPPPPPVGGPQDHGPGGPGGPDGKRFFEEADTNKDGFLTKDEMRAVQEKKLDQMFEHVDADKDGKLSKEELKKGHEEMRQKMRERFKAKKDADKAAE